MIKAIVTDTIGALALFATMYALLLGGYGVGLMGVAEDTANTIANITIN